MLIIHIAQQHTQAIGDRGTTEQEAQLSLGWPTVLVAIQGW